MSAVRQTSTASPHAGTTGIPDPWRYGNPASLPVGELVPWVIQEHNARRAGLHKDIRLGRNRMFSFATKKEIPEPGGRIAVYQTPMHRESYRDFEGVLPMGYGAGTVRTADYGDVLILKAKPDRIKFVVGHRDDPQVFSMIRMPGGKPGRGKSKGATWLMVNTTPTEGVPTGRQKYRVIPADKIDKLFDSDYVLSEKIDGAAAFARLMKDDVEVLSYRADKSGKPIVHTYRMGLGRGGLTIPKQHVGKTLRGEIWAERGGKAVPPQELGGILNSTVANAIRRQRAQNIGMRMAVFGIEGGDRDYAGSRAELADILKSLPPWFHLPREAGTPEGKRRLWEDIAGHRNPRTSEGVVGFPVAGGQPVKVKLSDERDVYVRGFSPGGGKYKGKGIGAVAYSLTPDGPIVGEIGSGLSDQLREDMMSNPDAYIGRVAKVRSYGGFPSGALRAPVMLGLHEDYPLAKAAELPDVSDLERVYDTLDAGHGRPHIAAVRAAARRLADRYARRDVELVDLAARLHDIGIAAGREAHEHAGADIVAGDPRFESLGARRRRLLINAIRQHRASTGKPRSTVAKIVSDADRISVEDTEEALYRAYAYGRHKFPDMSEDQNIRRSLQHLAEKYGPGGTGRRVYFPETGAEIARRYDPIVGLAKSDDIEAARAMIDSYERSGRSAGLDKAADVGVPRHALTAYPARNPRTAVNDLGSAGIDLTGGKPSVMSRLSLTPDQIEAAGDDQVKLKDAMRDNVREYARGVIADSISQPWLRDFIRNTTVRTSIGGRGDGGYGLHIGYKGRF